MLLEFQQPLSSYPKEYSLKNAVLFILAALVLSAQTAGDGPQFTTDGHLTLPKDYRQWVFLSSGAA